MAISSGDGSGIVGPINVLAEVAFFLDARDEVLDEEEPLVLDDIDEVVLEDVEEDEVDTDVLVVAEASGAEVLGAEDAELLMMRFEGFSHFTSFVSVFQ